MMLTTAMAYLRSIQRRLKDGTLQRYWYRVEGYREGGKVRQRVLEYLGTNPNRRAIPLPDVNLAARVAMAILENAPSPTETRKRLKALGIDLPALPQKVSLVYNPPLRSYALHCE